ncbi:RGS domain-containing protein [Plasmodiophora brassicae]|uniref:RGS domain-containing protein n=1 Tax=Plasmodiophora brassicae TaxID=37360 RepID=A0A0G4J6R7_PLABS|nr:hypothetical protein PBRA_002957 [Plasmodiophora brassicae]SPQ95438.1 unnamed protein product [Plasmodiophora brassicae]
MEFYPVLYSLLLLASTCYVALGAVQLWRTRRQYPVKYRRPDILLIVMVAYTGNIIVGTVPHCLPMHLRWVGVTELISQLVFADVVQSCITIIVVSLYSVFNMSVNHMRLVNVGESKQMSGRQKEAAVARMVQFISYCKFMLSLQFAVLFIVVNLAILLLAIVASVVISEQSVLVDTGLCRTWRASICVIIQTIGEVKSDILLCLTLAVIFRLRVVVDELGLKRNIRHAAVYWLISMLVMYAADQLLRDVLEPNWDLPQIIQIVVVDPGRFYILVMEPVLDGLKVMRQDPLSKRKRVENPNAHELFEQFLNTKGGFEAFRSHLEKEFAVENLLFWKAATEYRAASTKREMEERNIYRMYLAPGAPMEVQLPDAMKQHYHEMTFGEHNSVRPMTIKIVDENENATISLQTTALANVIVFDPAIKEIVSAMRHGAFQRFLQVQSNNELWVAFLYSRQAHGMYQNMVNRTPTKSSYGGGTVPDSTETDTYAARGHTETRPALINQL